MPTLAEELSECWSTSTSFSRSPTRGRSWSRPSRCGRSPQDRNGSELGRALNGEGALSPFSPFAAVFRRGAGVAEDSFSPYSPTADSFLFGSGNNATEQRTTGPLGFSGSQLLLAACPPSVKAKLLWERSLWQLALHRRLQPMASRQPMGVATASGVAATYGVAGVDGLAAAPMGVAHGIAATRGVEGGGSRSP